MKHWYKSKTLWINALTVAGMVLQAMSDKHIVDPQYVIVTLAVVNMFLRKITTSAIGK